MIKTLLFFLLVILFSSRIFSQEKQDAVSSLKSQLESFDYNGAVKQADSILSHKENYSRASIIEVYRMKAIAQYSLQDPEGAKASFNNLLETDSSYSLDSSNTSPKIISFFNQIKRTYLSDLSRQKPIYRTKTDTVIIHDESSSGIFKQAMIRSVVFPGLGHLYLDQNIKGITLSSLTAITLTSMIYYIIDANKKQKDYMNATDALVIQTKYNEYNTSYKMRNISIISLAAVWLYSQADILFFSGSSLPKLTGALQNAGNGVQVAFSFSL